MPKNRAPIVGILIALVFSGMTLLANAQNDRLVDADTDMEGTASSILQSKELQWTIFTGLFLIFLIMVAVLFKRYKNKKTSFRKPFPKVALYDNLWKGENLSFTPNVFSSESSPAILVAEHDNDLRLFITNTLRLNYRVISTSDGEEAFEKAFELVPDLIISNRFMPGIDGPLLCKKIKLSEVTSHIPVIILTPKTQSQISFEDWQDYADDHLPNTFDARELLMRVHKLIIQRKNLQKEYRKHIKVSEEEFKFPLAEQAFLEKLKRVLRIYHNDPLFGVEQLTDQLQMTRLQLYRKLKALTTQSPGDCIRLYRVEQAKHLLHGEGVDLKDVALRTGFNNLATFSKAFKEHTGISPTQYSLQNASNDKSMVED